MNNNGRVSEEKKYKKYTVADIEKYHKGLLSPAEMHELEKAALDDPFLADAMEGYGATAVNASEDISDLETRLEKRVNEAKLIPISSEKNDFKWWKVAAAIVLIGGIGFLTFRLLTGGKNDEIAKVSREKEKKSTVVAPQTDSTKLPNVVNPAAHGNEETLKTVIAAPSKKLSRKPILHPEIKSKETSLTPATAAPDLEAKISDSAKLRVNAFSTKDNSTETAAGNKQLVTGFYKLSENSTARKQIAQKNQPGINYFKGRVVDANNNPLPFANVTSTRYSVGTYADAQGNFTLISADSVLDVQVHSIGFENNLARLRNNNVESNKIILKDDNAAADKIVSYQKHDTSRSRNGSMKFEEPEPADGWSNYGTYLANNVNVPGDLKTTTNRAQVELSFEVNQNGDPVNIRVERSLCQKCDEEAVRLIKEGPKWKKKNKKVKRVSITIPFDSDH